jgi:hypothetical protein
LNIRAADAKEVGVGNPAEETCCYPNGTNVTFRQRFVNKLSLTPGESLPCRDFLLRFAAGEMTVEA